MRQYIEFILRFRLLVIGIIILVTAVFALKVKTLTMIFDPSSMLPQSHPHVATTNKVEEIFGSKYVVVVGITPKHGDIFQENVLAKVQRISEELLHAPKVVKANMLSFSARKAKSIAGLEDGLLVKPLLSDGPVTEEHIAALKQALATNPVYRDSVASANGDTAAILVEFKRDAKGFREIVDKIMPIIDRERDDTVDVTVGGVPIYVASLERYSERMLLLFPLAVLIIGLVHFDAFRTIQGLFLPLATAMLAVIWGMGLMAAMGVPMDVFNATTPILILAVSAGHAVQLLKRYYEEYDLLRATTSLTPKEANRQAVSDALTRIGPVMITAGVVAALGFFSLTVFDINTIRTYGIFTGLGILSAVVLEMTFAAALRSLLPPPKLRNAQNTQRAHLWTTIVDGLANLITSKRRNWIYGITGGFIVVALVGATFIKIDNSNRSFYSRDLQFQKDDAFLNSHLAGTNTLNILIEGKKSDTIKDPDVLRIMEKIQQFLNSQPKVGKTVSLVDFIKQMNQAMHANNPAFYTIPDSGELISQYLLLYSLSGEPGDFDLYVDQDYRTANLVAYLKTDSSAYLATLIPTLTDFTGNILKEEGHDKVSIQIGGSVLQAAALTEVMVKSKILNILQIAGVVFLVSSLVFRSFIGGLFVLLPLAAAVLINFGVIGLTGIPLNVPNSLTSAMVVGIGADYAIYILFRLREFLRDGVPLPEAIHKTMRTAGTACLYVAMAVAAGYSVLLLSIGFYIHAWIAILIMSAMMISVFAALSLIPSLILTFRPRFVFRQIEEKLPSMVTASATHVAVIVGYLLWPGTAQAEPLAPSDVMQRNYQVSRVEGSFANATYQLISSSGKERVRTTSSVTKLQKNGVDNLRVTRFLFPPDVRGTVILMIEHSERDDDMWVYLPGLKKVRRLVSSNKKDSFVGTDFSYGDVIGHRATDWNHRFTGEEIVDGQPCYVVESTPIDATVMKDSGYSKRITWVRKDNFAAPKSKFWDEKSQFLKSVIFRDIRLVDPGNDKWQGMLLEAENAQTDHKTIIKFDKYDVRHDIGDDYFTTRYMERAE